MAKWRLFVLMFVLLSASALAFECNGLGSECSYVKSTNLSDSEKDLVISTMIYTADVPDHALIRQWNTKIVINRSPDGVAVYSSGYIGSAWLRIFSVMPSVLYNGSLFAPANVTVQTAFNYNVILPSGPQPGDCRTDYTLANKQEQLRVYLNGNYQGNQKLQSVQMPRDSDIKSTLDVQATTWIDHYHTNWYCCNFNWYLGCMGWCSTCDYAGRDTKTDNLHLENNMSVRYYNPTESLNFAITDQYYGITKAQLNIENYTAFTLSTANSNFSKQFYHYKLNWTYPPYDVLTIQTEDYENEQIDNLVVHNNESQYALAFSNISNCSINVSDYFTTKTVACDLTYSPSNKMTQPFVWNLNFDRFIQPITAIVTVLIITLLVSGILRKKLKRFV